MRYFDTIEQVDAWIARMVLGTMPLSWAERKELAEADAWCAAACELATADCAEAVADLRLEAGRYPPVFDLLRERRYA